MPPAPLHAIEDAVRALDESMLLAVSGGRDSMALLEACARACPARVVAVATFDHGTGPAATRAARLVGRRARALGFRVVRGWPRASLPPREADWRRARLAFLRSTAARLGARVVTAHTRDDLVETVAMRVLRGSGARGLAAMLAPSPIARPFLHLAGADVARWAAAAGIRWIDDPSNASRRHLRNRLRLDLLPAIRAVDPAFEDALLELATRAAAVRQALDAVARRIARRTRDGRLVIAASALAGQDAAALAALWPALAARAGLALDGRGTRRAAAFTMHARTNGTVPLAGGFEIVRRRGAFVLGRDERTAPRSGTMGTARSWRLRLARDGEVTDAWTAMLPAEVAVTIRAWAPGDRMRAPGSGAARRVKRYFADAGIPGMDRAGWPVVVAGGEIVWIPGVRRSDAASDRSGRPGLRYVCERITECSTE